MEKYEILERIEDANGFVSRGRVLQDDSLVDMKIIRYDPKDGVPSSITREISFLQELKHDNVLRLLDAFDTKDGFCLVFERTVHNMSMYVEVDLSLKGMKDFLFQILQGLSYCHSQNVIHGDLKPVNLLINCGIVKLAGFGSAMRIGAPVPQYTTKVATDLPYTAPEYLLGIPYSTAVDIWSVGCIFAELSKGEALFEGATHEAVMTSIISVLGKPDENDWPGVTDACLKLYGEDYESRDFGVLLRGLETSVHQHNSPGFDQLNSQGFDLLTKMLCMNPTGRITASDALNHPFFYNMKHR